MTKFHARDGFNFERLPDGSVRITHELQVRQPVLRASGHSLTFSVVHVETVLAPAEWASVVTEVSAKADGQTHEIAEAVHAGQRHLPTVNPISGKHPVGESVALRRAGALG